MLNIDLLKNGFTQLKADPCAYLKPTRHGNLIIAVHVDDMLVANPSAEIKQWFENTFMTKYELTGQHNNFSYIGMTIKSCKNGLIINQLGYIKSMCNKYLPKKLSHYPSVSAPQSLLKAKSKSTPMSATKYLSAVMTLMYLARHTRPDILMPTTYLATKSASPTVEFYSDILHIIAYVSNTQHYSLQFSKSASMIPTIYADSSHLLHQDARGHGGIILSLGSGPIMTKSYKLKLNTRSSTESELVVLEASTSYAKWWHLLLSELQILKEPSIKVYQDNLSAIRMVENQTFDNLNKHLVNRVHLINDQLLDKVIVVKYCPTDRMLADILTKIMDKTTTKRLLLLMNFLLHEDRPR
jgi:hypothetical protein